MCKEYAIIKNGILSIKSREILRPELFMEKLSKTLGEALPVSNHWAFVTKIPQGIKLLCCRAVNINRTIKLMFTTIEGVLSV